ncbi:MAG: aspartate/glutamate racemase family protein [Oscillospiraceae bacterium]
MKKIGLVGGLGPASTVEYYLRLTQMCLGEKNRYPEIVIDSVDMSLHTSLFEKEDYDEIARLLLVSLENLKAAGAQLAAITTNTEHIVLDMIKDNLPLPVISIVDCAVEEIKKKGCRKIVVFGTEWTLKSGLFDKALTQAGLTPVIPSEQDKKLIGGLIYPNLENGVVVPKDKEKMLALANRYISKSNADSFLLGCTELALMIRPEDLSVPVIDTTEAHIRSVFAHAAD